ncbi:MAG: hypothetical protein ABIA93_08040 [Candidatus Woesearchaeota archaeon]
MTRQELLYLEREERVDFWETYGYLPTKDEIFEHIVLQYPELTELEE